MTIMLDYINSLDKAIMRMPAKRSVGIDLSDIRDNLNGLIQCSIDRYAAQTIIDVQKGRKENHEYILIGERASRHIIIELTAILRTNWALRELLEGACVTHADLCDDIIKAGADYCETCDDKCHPRLDQYSKWILVSYFEFGADITGFLGQVFIRVICPDFFCP